MAKRGLITKWLTPEEALKIGRVLQGHFSHEVLTGLGFLVHRSSATRVAAWFEEEFEFTEGQRAILEVLDVWRDDSLDPDVEMFAEHRYKFRFLGDGLPAFEEFVASLEDLRKVVKRSPAPQQLKLL